MTPLWSSSARKLRAEHAAAQAALVVIAGILLSGPFALWIVGLVHPQPAWQGPARFVAEAHWIQRLPYLGGLVLVGGCVALVAALSPLVPRVHRGRANLALALSAAFAALILLNYIIQTTFVPTLASPEQDALIAAFTMTNPRSLAWALEMWGYGVYGIATWAIAAAFGSSRLERITAGAFIANGVTSIAGGIATTVWPGWVLTVAGGIAFAGWNLLVIVMAALVVTVMRHRPVHAFLT